MIEKYCGKWKEYSFGWKLSEAKFDFYFLSYSILVLSKL